MFKKLLPILLATFYSINLFADGMIEGDTSLANEGLFMTPEVLEIQNEDASTYNDPFKKGITRSPAYATFGIDNEMISTRLDDLRHLSDIRYYRVEGVVEDNEADRVKVLEISPEDLYGDEFQGYYVKIASGQDENKLKLQANNLKNNHQKALSKNLILRAVAVNNKQKYYQFEYGPFRTKELAGANCLYLKSVTKNKEINCNLAYRNLVTDLELEMAQNSASLSLSQFALLDLKDKPFEFDLEKVKNMTLDVKVDESLGPMGFYVTNINEDGVYVTHLNGSTMLIPVTTFPVNLKQGNSTTTTQTTTPESQTITPPQTTK